MVFFCEAAMCWSHDAKRKNLVKYPWIFHRIFHSALLPLGGIVVALLQNRVNFCGFLGKIY